MIKPLHSVKSIAVFRALQLGDLLCSIPALRALRHAFPLAHITLIGLPWASGLLKRFPRYFDDFLHFPGYHGLPEQPFDPEAYADFEKKMTDREFDLLLQMQGNGTIVNTLLQNYQPRILAGFHNAESYVASPYFIDYPDQEPEVIRHLQLMAHLGIEGKGTHLEFPELPEDHKAIKELNGVLPERKYICIHPGSRGQWRQWPPSHFAMAADYCYEQGFSIVITGVADERQVTAEVIKRMHHPCVDLTGKTSLGVVALLIRKARMLIANCTGVSHIAAAVKTPSLIISMDGEPHRWAPLNARLHRVIDWTVSRDLEPVFNNLNQLLSIRKNGIISN
jgi:ADP-heptose:LPS heptosyltransferase